jgi:hypothetical protein
MCGVCGMTNFAFSQNFIHRQSRQAKVWQQADCLSECSRLNFPHLSNIIDRNSSVLEDELFHWIHIFICFAHRWMSWVFGIFSSGHTQVGKPLRDYVFCIVCSSEATFQHFESVHNIFPQFKVKFAAHIPFSQVSHFLGTPKSQMEQHTFVRNKTWLSNHTCLIPRRERHSRL